MPIDILLTASMEWRFVAQQNRLVSLFSERAMRELFMRSGIKSTMFVAAFCATGAGFSSVAHAYTEAACATVAHDYAMMGGYNTGDSGAGYAARAACPNAVIVDYVGVNLQAPVTIKPAVVPTTQDDCERTLVYGAIYTGTTKVASTGATGVPGVWHGSGEFPFCEWNNANLTMPTGSATHRLVVNAEYNGVRNGGPVGVQFNVNNVMTSAQLLGAMSLDPGQGLIAGQSLQLDDFGTDPGASLYNLIMQPDGNLVEHRLPSQFLWGSMQASGNFSAGGFEAVMQTDGNFCVYDKNGGLRWQSATGGHPGAVLRLQWDGNFVVYDSPTAPAPRVPNKALWGRMNGLLP